MMKEPGRRQRVILADQFLRRSTYVATMQWIHEKKLKNIVIIGGSASGFSSAWLILNGPASYKRNNALKAKPPNIPKAELK